MAGYLELQGIDPLEVGKEGHESDRPHRTRPRHAKTTAGTSVFVLKTMFSTQACFLWKNGLFFDLRILELRVEKKKPIKSTRATPGARA